MTAGRHKRIRHIVRIAAIACLVTARWDVGAQSQGEARSETGMMRLSLDGSQNPWAFPEWFVWERTFEYLSRISKADENLKRLRGSTRLTEVEFERLMAEVASQAQRQQRLVDKLRPIADSLRAQGKPPLEIIAELAPLTIDDRWAILDGRERLYQTISADSMFDLRQWIITFVVQPTKLILYGPEAEWFYVPW
jgi:hypothetical protein